MPVETEAPGEGDGTRRGLGQYALRFRVSGVAGFLVLLCVAFALLRPAFMTPGNLNAIISNAAILAIVAAAQAVVLITRNLDVSVGSIMGFSAYVTADFAARHPGVGLALLLMPLVIGGALGAINGLLVAYGRVSPLIATLGTLLGAHADIGSAVRIANKAAGIVVGKLGTAVVHPDELG